MQQTTIKKNKKIKKKHKTECNERPINEKNVKNEQQPQRKKTQQRTTIKKTQKNENKQTNMRQ